MWPNCTQERFTASLTTESNAVKNSLAYGRESFNLTTAITCLISVAILAKIHLIAASHAFSTYVQTVTRELLSHPNILIDFFFAIRTSIVKTVCANINAHKGFSFPVMRHLLNIVRPLDRDLFNIIALQHENATIGQIHSSQEDEVDT